ncbi:protein YhfH [Cytobacillus solani]|nr:protein YhfH [Cytobacillus solani]USK52786.1 YhfH family protein [Cytobacillus solani]
MINVANEKSKGKQGKVCPECGQRVHEHVETYLLECDRCLSKKAE